MYIPPQLRVWTVPILNLKDPDDYISVRSRENSDIKTKLCGAIVQTIYIDNGSRLTVPKTKEVARRQPLFSYSSVPELFYIPEDFCSDIVLSLY